MAWSPITKPTSRGWLNVNPQGREQYDQPDLMYDDPNVFYDGGDPNLWNKVSKPTLITVITGGYATGLLMPLTKTVTTQSDGWTKVPKAT